MQRSVRRGSKEKEGGGDGGFARLARSAGGWFFLSFDSCWRNSEAGRWQTVSDLLCLVALLMLISRLTLLISSSPSLSLSLLAVDRAMSPAQSEDSGLAPERGTTYATITLPRNALHLAINFAGK